MADIRLDAPRHVIVIMTDQHRADLTSREGFGVDCTPTLDRLAHEGCWFDRAYTAAPLCVPARMSMLTGRFPSAHGVRENVGRDPRYAADLIDVLSAAAYRTALIGKNHSHLTPDRLDHWEEYGHHGRIPREAALGPDHEFDDWLRANLGTTGTPTPFPVAAQLPSRIVDGAIDWFDTVGPDRSFLWLSFPEPHVPYQLPEPYFSTYAPDTVPPPATTSDALANRSLAWRYMGHLAELSGEANPEVLRRARANYVGMLRLIDDQIARLLGHLDRTGKRADTLIVFVADHGDFAGEYGLMRKGPGLPEVLTRIPLLFHGPGVVPSREPSPAHVSIVDLFPTLCELVGQDPPTGVQGRSLAPLLRSEPMPEPEFASAYAEQGIGGLPYREADFGDDEPGVSRRPDGSAVVHGLNTVNQTGVLRMVRAGRWKLIASITGEIELFDLEHDPYELTDRSAEPEFAQILQTMLHRLNTWLLRVSDPLPIPAAGYPRSVPERNYYWTD